MEIAENVGSSQLAEVTFAVRAAGTQDFTVIGVDDNAHTVFVTMPPSCGGH